MTTTTAAARLRRPLVALPLVLALALLAAAPLAAADEAPASPIRDQDLIFLGLMFRNNAKAYLEQPDASPRVKEIAEESAGWRGTPGDAGERFRKLAEGYNLITWGAWDEGREIATVLDLRLPAKLYEPGATVTARLTSLWERPDRFSTHYLAQLEVVGPDGKGLGITGHAHMAQAPALGTVKEIALALPADAAPGRYTVKYVLEPHHHDGSPSTPVLEMERSFYVVPGLDARLSSLEAALARAGEPAGEAGKLALSTVRWFDELYRQGQKEDVPGAYNGYPSFMVAGIATAGFVGERVHFDRELELPETLAARLGDADPLRGLEGDLRLAYTSPLDGERVPFRIFVPAGFAPGGAAASSRHPLVVALHGAGGDENAFMERYQGRFKQEAEQRGYLAVAVNGRGPYSGYRGAGERDVLDVTDLVSRLWPVDPDRVYLMGHSMGGMGTVLVGFDHAERWAALAPIAGFGQPSQLAKAPKMPLFLAQGDRDALVPVEGARAFRKAAETGGRDLEYVEKAGTDHLAIVEQVMTDAFDFFDAHRRE